MATHNSEDFDSAETPAPKVLRLRLLGSPFGVSEDDQTIRFLASHGVDIYGVIDLVEETNLWVEDGSPVEAGIPVLADHGTFDVEVDGHVIGAGFATRDKALAFGLWLIIEPSEALSASEAVEPF